MRTRSGPVIGNGFQVVGARKERPQRYVEPWIIFHQPPKLGLHRRMSFEHASCRLEDETLRSMEPRKVSRASSGFVQPDSEHRLGLIEKLSRFFEEQGSFRLQRSMPSVRISCIKGVRSLYEPAGYRMA